MRSITPVLLSMSLIAAGVYVWAEMKTDLPLIPPGDESETLAMECALCHFELFLDLQESAHKEHQVFCPSCHGAAKMHREVENNDVKPEVYFRSDDREQKIEKLCSACHLETVKELRAGEHQGAPALEKEEAADCSICHEPHK